jgi:hypothetical protein
MATGSSTLVAGAGGTGATSTRSSWTERLAWKGLNWQHLFWCTVLGLIVLTFNLDAFLRHVGSHSLSDSWTGTLARGLGQTPSRVVAPTLEFFQGSDVQLSALALTGTLVLLELYFVLVVLHAIRRRGFRIVAASLAGIAGGVLFLPLLIWSLVGALALWRIAVLPVVHFIARIAVMIDNAITAVINFLANLVGTLIAFAMSLNVVEAVLITVLGFAMTALWVKMPANRRLAVVWGLLAYVVLLVGLLPLMRYVFGAIAWLADRLAALLATLWDVIAPVFSWLVQFILAVSHWIADVAQFLGPIAMRILTWLVLLVLAIVVTLAASAIVAALTLLVFGLPGALLIDQFKVAWNSGRGRAAVFNSSFSLGLATALVLIVSSGNSELLYLYDDSLESVYRIPDQWNLAHCLASFWPESMENMVLPYLSASQAPLFDGILLLISAGISCIGMLAIWRLPEIATTSRYELIFPTIVFAALGALMGIVVGALLFLLNSIGGSDA